jgi:hypothetical protein
MFDIHKTVFNENGEQDERKAHKYKEGLIEEFAASPEGRQYIGTNGGIGWVWNMTDLGLNHLGVTPANMSAPDFEEILFELFPRKVSVEADFAEDIVQELRAFWRFVQRQYGLPVAPKILAMLDDLGTAKLKKLLSDPSKFGMAKSFFMLGTQAGFDMTTEEGAQAFLQAYNAGLAGLMPGPGEVDDWEDEWEDDWTDETDEESEDEERKDAPPRMTPKQRAEQRKRQRKARKRKGK